MVIEQGREPVTAFRCPLHGGDADERPLLASEGASILPWDAMYYLALLLKRLGANVSDSPLDQGLLDDVHCAAVADHSEVSSLSHILAMMARSNIMVEKGPSWRFTHAWRFDSALNDYVRG
jgi:hypothetical protein